MSEVVGPNERRTFESLDEDKTHLILYIALKQSFTTVPSYWIDLYYAPVSDRFYLLTQWSFAKRDGVPVVGSYVFHQVFDAADVIEAFKAKFDELTSKSRGSPWEYCGTHVAVTDNDVFMLRASKADIQTISVLVNAFTAHAESSGTRHLNKDLKEGTDKFLTTNPPKSKIQETFKEVQQRNKAKAKW